MKILELGSKGFIGSNTVRYLKEKGYYVLCADVFTYKFLVALHIPNIQILGIVEDICNCTIFDLRTDYLKNGVNNCFFIVEPKWNTEIL